MKKFILSTLLILMSFIKGYCSVSFPNDTTVILENIIESELTSDYLNQIKTCKVIVFKGTIDNNSFNNKLKGNISNATTLNFTELNLNYFSRFTNNIRDLKNISTIYFPNNMTEIPAYVCVDMNKLTKVVLPPTVTTINSQAFKGCKNLVDVNWNDLTQLETIGDAAFKECGFQGTFIIPNSVKFIQREAFYHCDNIKNLIINEDSQLEHIYTLAFAMNEGTGALSNVYVNANREIPCDKGAFDKTHTCGQTAVGTVTTRLHYPSDYYAFYVGLYKAELTDQNVVDENGVPVKGAITQNIINNAFNLAENGWHEFFSSGIPIGSESLYRTYSDNVAYLVPNPALIEIYLVYDYDKDANLAYCVQMKEGDLIPAKTGLIVHSTRVATVYLPYVENPEITIPYDNELYPDNYYILNNVEYKNYLKPIHGTLFIDNVEIVDGVKTYRNYFFNRGETAAARPGPDWNPEYITKGYGFFRATHGTYTVYNKAFLHLPADMTVPDNETIDDSGTLPQEQSNSFSMYVVNYNETKINEINIDNNIDNNYYTLSGIKVNNPTKGIYIKNNKKIVIK